MATVSHLLYAHLPPIQPHKCTECKRLLPATSFPLHLANLKPCTICYLCDWYWAKSNRYLKNAPENMSSLLEMEEMCNELRGTGGELRVVCEGLVVEDGLRAIVTGGDWIAVKDKGRYRSSVGPDPIVYKLKPASTPQSNSTSCFSATYRLKIYSYAAFSKTIFVLWELDLNGKEVKIVAEKGRGKARAHWLEPEGSTIHPAKKDKVTTSSRSKKPKKQTNVSKGRSQDESIIANQQLDMLASVLEAATQDDNIKAIISNKSKPIIINKPGPKRRVALTHYPLAQVSTSTLFHPVASTSAIPYAPIPAILASSTYLSPPRKTMNPLLSKNNLQPLSLADLLASPFLGSPPLPMRKQDTFPSLTPKKIRRVPLTNSSNPNHTKTTSPTDSPPLLHHLSSSPSNSNRKKRSRAEEADQDIAGSETESSEDDEEEDEGDWLTGFVKGQLGGRYMDPGDENEEDFFGEEDAEGLVEEEEEEEEEEESEEEESEEDEESEEEAVEEDI